MGSIRYKGKGKKNGKDTWQISTDIGRKEDGTRKRHYETVPGSRSAANKRLRELEVNKDKGIFASPGRLTVADSFHNWLKGYVKIRCSERTLGGYTSIVKHHLLPNLGHIQLKQLQPYAIEEYYGKALQQLSPRTVHHHHRVLSQSLKYAVRQGYLGRNPCELVSAPSPKKKHMRTLTREETKVLLDVAKGSFYYPIIYTAVSSGLRQAELLGLRWRDVDTEMMSLSVSQVLYKREGKCEFKEPKTSHSRRSVSMTTKLSIFLRDYKKERELLCQQIGEQITLDDLVFVSVNGKPMNPSVVSHNFSKLVEQAGLTNVRFHDLRHTFASLMFKQGVQAKVISEALGHASVAFTMDTYSHIIEGMQSDAMMLLNDVLPDGVNNGNMSLNCRYISKV